MVFGAGILLLGLPMFLLLGDDEAESQVQTALQSAGSQCHLWRALLRLGWDDPKSQ